MARVLVGELVMLRSWGGSLMLGEVCCVMEMGVVGGVCSVVG